MTNAITVDRQESGIIVEINPFQKGADRDLSKWVAAHTIFEFKKSPKSNPALTLTSADFTFNLTTNNADWLMTSAHLDKLKDDEYILYGRYRNNDATPPLKETGKSSFHIEES